MSETVTVEIPLPLEAECWICDEVYYLNEVTATEVVAMATRTWQCGPCRGEDGG